MGPFVVDFQILFNMPLQRSAVVLSDFTTDALHHRFTNFFVTFNNPPDYVRAMSSFR
tara:strand:+ start:315 stop:485 length:171 start_codon:yes stop_codon:yes gene_type:complete